MTGLGFMGGIKAARVTDNLTRRLYSRPEWRRNPDTKARATAELLRRIAVEYAVNEPVRSAMRRWTSGIDSRRRLDMIAAIRAGMTRDITYRNDPATVEDVTTPDVILQERQADCDGCCLQAAAYLSAGIPCRIVIWGPRNDGPFQHVFVEAEVKAQGGRQQWVCADWTVDPSMDAMFAKGRREVFPIKLRDSGLSGGVQLRTFEWGARQLAGPPDGFGGFRHAGTELGALFDTARDRWKAVVDQLNAGNTTLRPAWSFGSILGIRVPAQLGAAIDAAVAAVAAASGYRLDKEDVGPSRLGSRLDFLARVLSTLRMSSDPKSGPTESVVSAALAPVAPFIRNLHTVVVENDAPSTTGAGTLLADCGRAARAMGQELPPIVASADSAARTAVRKVEAAAPTIFAGLAGLGAAYILIPPAIFAAIMALRAALREPTGQTA